MTTTIDFDALQVSEGPKVTLLANQNVGGAGLVGPDFADFSSFASLSVDVKVQRTAVSTPSPSLTVLIEHSDDGLSWSTAETFTFTNDGAQTASLASPKAHLRARASGSGAEWYVNSVNVAPHGVDVITGALSVDNSVGSDVALTVTGDGADDTAEFHTGDGSYLILYATALMELYNAVAPGARFFLDDNAGGTARIDSGFGVFAFPSVADSAVFSGTVGSGTGATGLAITGQGSVGGFKLDANARPVLQTHTAPADAGLAAGDCALWFDQTNGAAKLMVKAKTANGTVVTGSLALAP